MKKRKRRYYIDVTFSHAVEMRKGRICLSLALDDLELNVLKPYYSERTPVVQKLSITEIKGEPDEVLSRRSKSQKRDNGRRRNLSRSLHGR